MLLKIITPVKLAYEVSLVLQRELVLQRSQGLIPDTVILVEHPSVYTVGRREEEPRKYINGISVVKVDRGGKTTFHGPGQLIVYPILDLDGFDRDVRGYVLFLEMVAMDVLKEFGIISDYKHGYPGVWTGNRKIAATGIRVNKMGKRWIVSHGLALNVSTDLANFNAISPCGLNPDSVTSMERELNEKVNLEAVAICFQREFRKQYEKIMEKAR